jgi:hypothetical protein
MRSRIGRVLGFGGNKKRRGGKDSPARECSSTITGYIDLNIITTDNLTRDKFYGIP